MNTVKMQDITFSDDIFQPMLTKTPIDAMFSYEGGIFPATNYMLIGGPGSGKTTLGLDVLANVQTQDPDRKVLFISAEMNRIDMFGFVKRYPKFGELAILFTGEHTDQNIQTIIEEELAIGYDLVLADSFVEIQESVIESEGMSRNQSEKWLIDLMNSHNLGANKAKKHTSFIMVQQVTKGGVFAGSNKLKHNTTGMCELRHSKDYSDERFLAFTKNRRGSKHERLFYSLEPSLHVKYDQKRLERDSEVRKLRKQEQDSITSDKDALDQLLDSLPITISKETKPTKINNFINHFPNTEDLPF